MKFYGYILLTLLFISNSIIAQDLPVAGFDTNAYHPVFIQSKKGTFKLNLGMYTQFRYNTNLQEDLPDSIPNFTRGYNLARTRIFLEGDVTDKLYYHFRFNINQTGNIELFVAYLQYNIKKNMTLRMGRQFMALGREDWMYPQELLSVEFSAHDFTFAIWTSMGFQFHHNTGDRFRYWVGLGNGAYGSRRQFPGPLDSDVALTTRAEYNILGSDWDRWDQMAGRKDMDFGMLLGAGIGHNVRFDEQALITDAKNATQLNLDFSILGKGWHFFAQGSLTNRQYSDSALTEDNNTGGGYATLGYWVGNRWIPYLRCDYVAAGNIQNKEDYLAPGIGINFYPFHWSNRYKFTAEYNYLGTAINNTIVEPDGQLGWVANSTGAQHNFRIQMQFGF